MGIRLTQKIFDENKNRWCYLESRITLTEGVIKNAYYGHGGSENLFFGLHIELEHQFENSRFYLGNFKDIAELRYKSGVKRLKELTGKKVNIHKYDLDTISGFSLMNYNHKQLKLF